MSFELINKVNQAQKKQAVVDARSGDTVRVHQKIKEGNKERIQVFEGVVIRTDNKQSHTSRITVRKIASGVGVEKSFLLHSPLVEKVEIVRRAKVRRNFLSYLRERSGKSARLTAKSFDRAAVNDVRDAKAEAEAERLKEEAAKEAAAKQAEKENANAELAAKQAEEQKVKNEETKNALASLDKELESITTGKIIK
jgi:large subunit ribosomal protein L19